MAEVKKDGKSAISVKRCEIVIPTDGVNPEVVLAFDDVKEIARTLTFKVRDAIPNEGEDETYALKASSSKLTGVELTYDSFTEDRNVLALAIGGTVDENGKITSAEGNKKLQRTKFTFRYWNEMYVRSTGEIKYEFTSFPNCKFADELSDTINSDAFRANTYKIMCDLEEFGDQFTSELITASEFGLVVNPVS